MATRDDFIRDVKTGDNALVCTATHDNAAGDAPAWSSPQRVELYVERRSRPYTHGRGPSKRIHPAGELLILTIKGGHWAEHELQDWSKEDCTFSTENFYMKILDWNGNPLSDGPAEATADTLQREINAQYINNRRGH